MQCVVVDYCRIVSSFLPLVGPSHPFLMLSTSRPDDDDSDSDSEEEEDEREGRRNYVSSAAHYFTNVMAGSSTF